MNVDQESTVKERKKRENEREDLPVCDICWSKSLNKGAVMQKMRAFWE